MSTTAKTTALGFVFDATKVAPQTAPEAFPGGWYLVHIEEGETTTNDDGKGKRASLTFEILEGAFKGRRAFDGLQLQHSNPQAQSIGQAQFSAICHAVGVYQVERLELLFKRPFMAKFDIEAGRWVNADNETIDVPAGAPAPANAKFYEAKNRYRGCKAATAGGSSTAPAAPAGPAPGWAVTPGTTPPPPPTAAPATPPPAPPPFAQTPPPPATPPPAATPPKKPGRPPKKVERKFWIGADGFEAPVAESVVVANLQKGMPADTPICLENTEEWKTAADFGISANPTPPPAAATPPPVAPPVTPPPAPPTTPAGPPPWNRTA